MIIIWLILSIFVIIYGSARFISNGIMNYELLKIWLNGLWIGIAMVDVRYLAFWIIDIRYKRKHNKCPECKQIIIKENVKNDMDW